MSNQTNHWQKTARMEEKVFERYANKLRAYLLKIDSSSTVQFSRTKNPHARHDFTMYVKYKGKTKGYIVEVKVRKVSSDTYDSVLLEQGKYKALLSIAKDYEKRIERSKLIVDGGVHPIYLNYYEGDKKARWCELSTIDLEIESRNLPSNSSGAGRYIKKQVIHVPNDQTKMLDLS